MHQLAPGHRGGLYAWEFEKDGRELNVRVEGQLIFNEARMMIMAATAGAGLAYLLEDQVKPIADGRLVRVPGIVARPSRVIISTIRAVGRTRPRSRCW
jgi:DNA-binding transcriptional LysR family regulator